MNLQPSEFWHLRPRDFWYLLETLDPPEGAKQILSDEDRRELSALLREAERGNS